MRINKEFLVHAVLGHSYLVYFVALVAGLLIKVWYPLHLLFPFSEYAGLFFLVAGPALIIWAQSTSHNLAVKQITTDTKTTKHDFYRGPYTFTRSPTHLGLAIMVLGLGLVLDSGAIVICTLLAFILTRVVFLSKEEKLLQEKYGDEYTEYKERVKI